MGKMGIKIKLKNWGIKNGPGNYKFPYSVKSECRKFPLIVAEGLESYY